MDRINNLPPGILRNILCLLPIQEAVRTSILSREWRYRWIKLSKLVFIEGKLQVLIDGAEFSALEQTCGTQRKRIRLFKKRKFLAIINQVLSKHEGPIHEFTLSMKVDPNYSAEIDHILSHLAQRNTVKKLKLRFGVSWYKLPLSVFSFRQLTDLCIEGSYVIPPPTFDGFGSLARLSLQNIFIADDKIQLLLSNCRSLKRLNLDIDAHSGDRSGNEDSSIISLFECLAVVETLSISLGIILLFKSSVHRVPQELPTTLIHLKYLTLIGVSFRHKHVFSILVLLIKCSPNLKKLKIDNGRPYFYTEDGLFDFFTYAGICSFQLEAYADIWLEHLNELDIRGFRNEGNELNFVKLILSKSPVLRKVRIYHKLTSNELMQISNVLLSFPRASSVVDINV